ncbi:MAG: hypothetical protein K2H12_10065, partial [Acetatifactor sp.]|nr:hypothetical protein [Acetatifactor sp.]
MRPGNGHSPIFAMKTPDGEPIFIWQTGPKTNSYVLMYYDKTAQKPRQLLQLKESLWDNSWVAMLNEDGYLYFMDKSGRLNRCDLYTGKREYCLGYGKLGLGDWPGHVSMVQGPDGEPIFLDTLEGDVICRLGTEEPETAPIHLVSFSENCSFFGKAGATVFLGLSGTSHRGGKALWIRRGFPYPEDGGAGGGKWGGHLLCIRRGHEDFI